jgi:hypothetical protein
VGNEPTTQKKCRFGVRLNLIKKLTHQDLATTNGGELTVTYYSARKYSKDVIVTEIRYKTNGAQHKLVHKTTIVVDMWSTIEEKLNKFLV